MIKRILSWKELLLISVITWIVAALLKGSIVGGVVLAFVPIFVIFAIASAFQKSPQMEDGQTGGKPPRIPWSKHEKIGVLVAVVSVVPPILIVPLANNNDFIAVIAILIFFLGPIFGIFIYFWNRIRAHLPFNLFHS